MAWDGMGAFVRALEQRSELVRISRRVDPKLEVSAIADRVMKAGGPALLFENVGGSPFPLLINAFGSRARMSLALGVDDIEDHARALAELVRPPAGGPEASCSWFASCLNSPTFRHERRQMGRASRS